MDPIQVPIDPSSITDDYPTVVHDEGSLTGMIPLVGEDHPSSPPHLASLTMTDDGTGIIASEEVLRQAQARIKSAPPELWGSYLRASTVVLLVGEASAGKLSLRAQDTKTETPRVLYLKGDLLRVLTAWKQRCDQKWPKCPWICHRGGIRLESLKHSWRKAYERVGLGKMVEVEGTTEKVWIGKIPHDFRRTAVRNMVRAGVPEKVAMAISGHKTRSVFDRYNIVNEADLEQAAKSMTAYFERERAKMVTVTFTLPELVGESSSSVSRKEVESSAEFVELARGIEPPTCGLQNRCSAIELRQPGCLGLQTHRDSPE
jgi:hypothetical protein